MATAGPSAGEKRPASPEVQDHTPKRVKIEEPATETPAESSESKVSNSKSRGNRGRRGRHSNNNQRGGGRSNNKDPQSGGGTYGERSKGGKEDEKKEPRLPKRKVALLMGYQGTGMYGSQINPGVKTVEGVLFDSLIQAKCISEDNADDHSKVQLARAARTDAGVHALINCIVLKLILTPPIMKPNATLEQHINSFLPPELRVWKIIRVQGGFNPRTTCDGRRYEYAFPSYCLLPPRPATALGQMASTKGGLKLWDNDVPPNSKADPSQVSAQSFWQTFPLDGKKSESGAEKHAPEMELRRAFRLKQSSPHLLDALREASQLYIGNHNFHNFTNDKAFTDRSAMRQIKSIEISDPVLVADETEWISVVIHGQSFMLHQIRKMMGLLIMLVRLRCPPSIISETFGPSKIHIPKAPALGLMLRGPIYDNYNKKVKEAGELVDQGKLDDSARKETLQYDSFEPQVQEFKKHVLKDMWDQEAKIDAYTKFLVLLDGFPGNDFAYLNAQGTIPKESVFVNGKLPAVSKQGKPESEQPPAPEFDDGEAEEKLAPNSKNEDG